MTLERIVVGVDFNEPALSAARWTAARFGGEAELVLAHAVDIPAPPSFLSGMLAPQDELVVTARRGAEARLRELGGSLGAERVWTEVRDGKPADVLQSVAQELGAGMVVAGEHGRRRGVWNLLGSTAERLVRESSVPVLVARALSDGPPRRILVPVPSSELASVVLGWARSLAQRFDARVGLLFVLNPMLHGRLQLSASPVDPSATSGAERGAEEWLGERLKEAGFAPGEAETAVAWGDPAQEILAAADRFGAELIVMGSRATRTPGHGLLGTVTRSVLRGGTAPVLVVPASTTATDRPDAARA